MNPFRTLSDAITLPFTALGTIALCLAINAFTSPGHWWVQWVVLGMGIAVVCAWWRAFKLIVIAALVGVLGRWAYQRWGEEGRQRVQAWLQTPPQAP